jgi:hypothetical protein
MTKTNKQKFYIYCPYEDKEEAKSLGAKWDKDKKLWYAPNKTIYNKLKKFHFMKLQIISKSRTKYYSVVPPSFWNSYI